MLSVHTHPNTCTWQETVIGQPLRGRLQPARLQASSDPEPCTRRAHHSIQPLSCGLLQEQLQLTPGQKQHTLRLRSEYLAAMQELLRERAALNVAIQAAATHTLDNARVADDHAKVRSCQCSLSANSNAQSYAQISLCDLHHLCPDLTCSSGVPAV